MNKVLEYLGVAVVSIGAFMLLVYWIGGSIMDSHIKDCKTMGQFRHGGAVIVCSVKDGQ